MFHKFSFIQFSNLISEYDSLIEAVNVTGVIRMVFKCVVLVNINTRIISFGNINNTFLIIYI